jgi:hypothetical protein
MAGTSELWDDLFDDTNNFFDTGPPITDEIIQAAEAQVGYKLPASYLRLVNVKNGGWLRRRCYPTAEDYVEIDFIYGIGGARCIDSKTGSRYFIQAWNYPDVGIVVGETPSAGHDTIMLDYSECGPQGEPRVIHVETETGDAPAVRVLAPDFETFLRGLVDCDQFDEG